MNLVNVQIAFEAALFVLTDSLSLVVGSVLMISCKRKLDAGRETDNDQDQGGFLFTCTFHYLFPIGKT